MTYTIRASHSKKFSSLVGPAMIPSGGFSVSSEKEEKLYHVIIAESENVLDRLHCFNFIVFLINSQGTFSYTTSLVS